MLDKQTKDKSLSELIADLNTQLDEMRQKTQQQAPAGPTPSPLVNAFQRISHETKAVTDQPVQPGLLNALIARNIGAAH